MSSAQSLKKRKLNLDEHDLILDHGEFLFYSNHGLRSDNNHPEFQIDVAIEEDAGGGVKVITIQNGNYTSSTYLTALKAEMEAASFGTLTYTPIITSLDGKLEIASSAAFSIYVANSSSVTGFTIASLSNVLHESTNVFNISYSNTLLLRGNFGTQTGRSASVFNNSVYNNVITSIPITENSGEVVHYNPTNPEYFKTNFTAQDIDLYFTDENSNLIDFNGGIWSVKIQYTHAVQRQ